MGGGSQKKHVCHWAGCTQSFDQVATLGKHILDHHINCYASSDPLSTTCQWANCPRMEKAFSTKMKLIMHVRAHTGEKPYACSVPGCSKKFSRMDILNKHLKSHGNSSNFVCVIHGCGKVFPDAASLNKHKESHPASKPFVCPVEGCGKRYTDGTGLYKHTEQVHQDNPLVRGQVSAQLNESVAALKAGVQPSPRRGLTRSQPLQKLLLQQHFQEFESGEPMSDNESDASAVADSDSDLDSLPPRINTSHRANVNDFSDYDDEDSPRKATSGTKRVSFSSSSDGDESAAANRAPVQPYTASIMPPSSTGNIIAAPTMPVMATTKNGVPAHMQSSFRVSVNQALANGPRLTSTSTTQVFPAAAATESHEATLKRRSTEVDDSYNPPLVAPEGFSSPLRHSPSLGGAFSQTTSSSFASSFRPSKQQRLRLSVSEPNLKAYADDDDDEGHATDDDERILPTWARKNRRGSQQHPHQPPTPQQQQQQQQQQPPQGQEGALDLLLYFSQHPKQSTSVPTSPTPSPTPHPADALKLPPIASLRLGSPVMATVDPRYNSFTSLSTFSNNNQAPPTTPVRAPISPSLPEGGQAPVLPALSSFTNPPALPPMSGGSFTFTKPMFADRPIKNSQSAPNLSSEGGLSSLSFVVSHPNLLAHTGMSFNPQQGK